MFDGMLNIAVNGERQVSSRVYTIYHKKPVENVCDGLPQGYHEQVNCPSTQKACGNSMSASCRGSLHS